MERQQGRKVVVMMMNDCDGTRTDIKTHCFVDNLSPGPFITFISVVNNETDRWNLSVGW